MEPLKTISQAMTPPRSNDDYSAEAARLAQNVAPGARSLSTAPPRLLERHPFIIESEEATQAAGRTMEALRDRRRNLLEQLRETDEAIASMSNNLHAIAN